MKNQFIFSNLYSMKKQVLFLIYIFIVCVSKAQTNTIIIESMPNSTLVNNNTIINEDTTLEMINKEIIKNLSSEEELIYRRIKLLDESSPIDFSYNKSTKYYINRYLERDVKLISRMLGISPYYFPMIEQQLDRFQIPLELKYLAIVESSLNPKARSRSGATGL